MNAMAKRRCAFALVLISALGAMTSAMADAKIPLRFRGDWQGTLVRATLTDSTKGSTWDNSLDTRIVISDDEVRLYRRDGKGWEPLGPGALHTQINDTNAVFTTLFFGDGGGDYWEVTLSITASLVDSKHLHIAFVRHAKNKRTHRSDPDTIWLDVSYGTLKRVPNADV